MSESANKAVFLSYASQDAEAAKRICEALRAAGVEVWFDSDGGLEHGDEWDAKIRRQIKECVLFLPLISANTQAREEGYFRIEWELAAERAMGIASGTAFVLPIVIDDTREPAALVPDRFRKVQWTRLPDGVITPEVQARFLKLWSHRAGVVAHQTKHQAATVPLPAPLVARPGWPVYAGLALAIFAVAGGATWWFLRAAKRPPAVSAVVAQPAADFPADPNLRKAITLAETINSTAEDHALAEDIAKEVLARHPTDPEAVIVNAYIGNRFILRGFDLSEERYASSRRLCERALLLAPDHPEALHVLGQHLTFRQADIPRAQQLLRRAVTLQPDRAHFYNSFIEALEYTDRTEALRFAEQAVARFPHDAILSYRLSLVQAFLGNLAAYEKALDDTLTIGPVATAVIRKAQLMLSIHRDIPAAKLWLDRVPESFRLNDRTVYLRYLVASASGDTEDALRALNALPGDFLRDFTVVPKRLLVGDLLDRQGKPALARREYEAALADIAREKIRSPNHNFERFERWLLVGLGRSAEAGARAGLTFAAVDRPYSLRGNSSAWFGAIQTLLTLDERAKALELLREAVTDEWSRRLLAGTFALDPHLARWREDAEIKALLAEPHAAGSPRDWPKNPELKRAVALLDRLDAIPEDLRLAEELVQQVLDKAPTDPETVTAMARVHATWLLRGWDRSTARYQKTIAVTERALQLAPDEAEAHCALAIYIYARGIEPLRARESAQRAVDLFPLEPRFHRMRDNILFITPGLPNEEAFASARRTVALFPLDPLVRYELARHYRDLGRWEEFERETDATLALGPVANALAWKARAAFGLHGDLAAMKAQLDQVPARVRMIERTVYSYFLYAAFSGNITEGLDALHAMPETWMIDFDYRGPKALLVAALLELAGKKELARLQYTDALAELLRARERNPSDVGSRLNEAWILHGLGRDEEARAALRIFNEAIEHPYRISPLNSWWFTPITANLLLGDRATAVELLREAGATAEGRATLRARLELDRRMAAFREDPEIKALLAEPVVPRTVDGGPSSAKATDGTRRTEDGGQKTESRRQRAVFRSMRNPWPSSPSPISPTTRATNISRTASARSC